MICCYITSILWLGRCFYLWGWWGGGRFDLFCIYSLISTVSLPAASVYCLVFLTAIFRCYVTVWQSTVVLFCIFPICVIVILHFCRLFMFCVCSRTHWCVSNRTKSWFGGDGMLALTKEWWSVDCMVFLLYPSFIC